MYHPCKKCLLLEAGENKSYQTVRAYIDNLDNSLKAEENLYRQRLSMCKTCPELISGMCLKCGCYVEVRAVLKDNYCPNTENRLW